MWFLYLDESGDLGFDFVNKKPSKFFTIAILEIKSVSIIMSRDLLWIISPLKRRIHAFI